MIVNSTELQNNFGKYLVLAAREDITVTRNGIPIAKLIGLNQADTAKEGVQAYPAPGSVTYQEFQEMTRNSEERYELIDGEVYLLALGAVY
jgi:prevent-host-death family protein